MKPLSGTTNANLIIHEQLCEKIDIPTVKNTGDAVGVPEKHWFVAIVNNNTEKACADKLGAAGYEAYVPTQRETRRYSNGRKKVVDRVVMPAILLLHATEEERKEVVNLPYIYRFMTDRARTKDKSGHHPIATIPDGQVDRLKFMLYNSSSLVSIESIPFRAGNMVRVIRGSLRGLVGKVMADSSSKLFLIVDLGMLGYAKVVIDTTEIERIQ